MTVRPFYFTAFVDGCKTNPSGGPRSKTGGQQIILKQRKDGESVTAFSVLSYAEDINGVLYLVTKVFDHENKKVAEYKTKY